MDLNNEQNQNKQNGAGRNMSYASKFSAANRNNPYYKFHKKIHEELIKEIEAAQVDFDGKVTQNSLNPALWKDGKLDPEVRKKLIRIAKHFYDSLKIKAKIKDLVITGSNTNYNWNKFSDIDLHLIVDYKDINDDVELVREYLEDKKRMWAQNHDIKIHDYDVELYAQSEEQQAKKDAAVYSLSKNDWIKEPKKENVKVDVDLVKKKAADVINMIEDLPSEKDAEKLVDKAEKIKDRIKKLRQSGLDTGGEYSPENLAFKVLRNKGYLQKLSDISNSAIDKDLSIDETFASKDQQKYFYAQANKGGKEGKKWKEMADEFSQHTDFKDLPNKVKEDQIKGGKGDDRSDSDFDPKELTMGVATEQEHTKDLALAKEIAKDHLTEDPHYYSKLKKAGLADELDEEFLKVYHGSAEENLEKLEGDFLILSPEEKLKLPSTGTDKIGLSTSRIEDKALKYSQALGGNRTVALYIAPDAKILKVDNGGQGIDDMFSNEELEDLSNKYDAIIEKSDGAESEVRILRTGKVFTEKDYNKMVKRNLHESRWAFNEEKHTDSPDDLEGEEFKDVKREKNILSIQDDIKGMTPEKVQAIMDFIKFCCNKMHLKNKVKVVLRKGRDEYIKTTASYLPSDDENHIRCEGRSLVDICRSIAHELTHNRQREMGAFKPGETVQNIGGHLESQADTMAGILIKDFTHHQGYDHIYDM